MSAAIRSSQGDTPRRNARQNKPRQIAISLDDFVRDASQGTTHHFRIEDADGVGVR